MKKILLPLFAALVLTACSEDQIAVENQDANAKASISEALVTNYSGVFTTMDSETRATVSIEFPSVNSINTLAKATLTLANGKEYTLTAEEAVDVSSAIENLHFYNDKMSFDFTVDTAGDNPVVSNALFAGKESDILVVAHKGGSVPLSLTGTYVCLDCGTHPTLGTGVTQTFNVVFPDGYGNATNLTTQIILGSNNYGSPTGNQAVDAQSFATNSGTVVSSAKLDGAGSVPGLNWEGAYREASTFGCEGVTGTWSFDSAFGMLTGTFQSDNDCFFRVAEGFQGFDGSGFAPSPTAGQLDSDFFSYGGASDGGLAYGGTVTSGDGARGLDVDGGVGSGGIYSFENSSTSNRIVGIQPTGSDFTPGYIEYRYQNTSGGEEDQLFVSYTIWSNNDQARSNSLTLSVSADGVSYTDIPAADFATVEAAAAGEGFISENRSGVSLLAPLGGITLANGDFLYIRWSTDDISGSGSRDEIGIDAITINND
ncbi:membrane lipoprotein lipid attachment site-containing protein [Gilvibacter sediminis]|uniref:membrane lipoprotein lipid attachment site-containing protein n=1 Tax=Gilvibacter sediminis TaxID=379071 RepID=UPI002350F9B9|nr:membrane lipoprotein lipid attachment site-containing protein [Gilvibacter sediminis]MDC7999167.1 membrane lipoprotein lipid attachment site-containing protein [Gilvibacter sediminis]